MPWRFPGYIESQYRLEQRIVINNKRIAELEERNSRLEKAAEAARRWAKRKGHGSDHDCDLCNSLRALDISTT
jgi:hypothetical protein